MMKYIELAKEKKIIMESMEMIKLMMKIKPIQKMKKRMKII